LRCYAVFKYSGTHDARTTESPRRSDDSDDHIYVIFCRFDAPRSQKLIRPTGALEFLNAFNDRLLLRLRRPLFISADFPLRSQFADPVLPLPASMRHGVLPPFRRSCFASPRQHAPRRSSARPLPHISPGLPRAGHRAPRPARRARALNPPPARAPHRPTRAQASALLLR
jgi:hypothetical protein